ncbi:hypothetical protein BC936DRAFT_149933 [Jimgerdemannia flammicorona]|uniref:Uncharacterized protein n=1 Tax=Jimgerdemannia flammicorona TaxID=994334 RepID=A0A433DN11_9FUNG|nr:hypothetical protein BC936DRAFT_149933 [Jimgerdemannia flammicorona]
MSPRTSRFSHTPKHFPRLLKTLTVPKARYEVFTDSEEDPTSSGDHEMSDLNLSNPDLPLPPPSPRTAALAQHFEHDATPGSGNFVRTMRHISLEARRKRAASAALETLFFTDKKCMDRATFMAARLKQNFPALFTGIDLDDHSLPLSFTLPAPSPVASLATDRRGRSTSPNLAPRNHSQPRSLSQSPAADQTNNLPLTLAKHIASRLYTLNLVLFVLPHTPARDHFLKYQHDAMSPTMRDRRGGLEAHFAVRWALDETFGYALIPKQKDLVVERARTVVERCLESEEKLSMAEKECMYVFHGMMSGVDWVKEGCMEVVGVPRELEEEAKRARDGVVKGVEVPGGIDESAFFEAVVGAQRV